MQAYITTNLHTVMEKKSLITKKRNYREKIFISEKFSVI